MTSLTTRIAMNLATIFLVCMIFVMGEVDETTTTQLPPQTTSAIMAAIANSKRFQAKQQQAQQGLVAPVADSTIENALKDSRYMAFQIKCTLGEGPCDHVGRKIKALVPLVMRNMCVQCTPQETRQIKQVASHIQRNHPTAWSKIISKYGST